MEDLTGKRFGRLTVIEPAERNGFVKCKCDCGNEYTVQVYRLTSGNTRSCGCLRRDLSSYRIQKNASKIHSIFKKYGTNVPMMINQKLRVNNKSGYTGVWHDEKNGKWWAYITFHGKRHHLGTFSSLDEAIEARSSAFGKFFAPIIDEYKADTAAAL